MKKIESVWNVFIRRMVKGGFQRNNAPTNNEQQEKKQIGRIKCRPKANHKYHRHQGILQETAFEARGTCNERK